MRSQRFAFPGLARTAREYGWTVEQVLASAADLERQSAALAEMSLCREHVGRSLPLTRLPGKRTLSLNPNFPPPSQPRHHKSAKGKSFLGTPQGKICPALLVHPLTQKRNIIWRFCGALVVKLKCLGSSLLATPPFSLGEPDRYAPSRIDQAFRPVVCQTRPARIPDRSRRCRTGC